MGEHPKRMPFFGCDSVGGTDEQKLYFDLLMGTNYSESDPIPNPETESPDEVREEGN